MKHQLFKQILNKMVDFLLPAYCVCCGKNGSVLCSGCYQLIHFNLQPITNRLICHDHLDQVVTLAVYQPPISQLIKALKYQHVKLAGSELAKLLYWHLQIPEHNLISYAPISRGRLNERGFNQAQLIATNLAKLLNKPSVSLLLKSRETKKQAHSTIDQRLKNLENSFVVDPTTKEIIPNSIIVIIDDVISTGSTLDKCAKVLKEAGAKEVIGVALAQSL